MNGKPQDSLNKLIATTNSASVRSFDLKKQYHSDSIKEFVTQPTYVNVASQATISEKPKRKYIRCKSQKNKQHSVVGFE